MKGTLVAELRSSADNFRYLNKFLCSGKKLTINFVIKSF